MKRNALDIINQNQREFKEPTQTWQQNRVFLNTGNTLDHELLKCAVAYNLIQQGRTIVCEAKLKNGKRPDILVIDIYPPKAYEILKSETDAMLEKKRLAYLPIQIIPIRVETK